MGIYNKSWWVWINRDTLDCFVCKCQNVMYFDSFGVEHIPREIKKS